MEIISILRTIKDPRREHLREHSFECIFYIAMAAVIGGAESWYEVADFGKMHEAFFSSRIKDFKRVPSHDTFNRVFSILSPDELENGFRTWIRDICGKYRGLVAIDGKEICGAREEKCDGSFESLRIVSAWASANGVSLGQEKVSEKSNEIKAIPLLIKALDLEGCIITIDAIACQHEIVDVIIDAKADYLISVKKNQKKLCKTIEDYFSEIDIYGNKLNGKGHIPETRYRYSISEESSHGRLEKRVCQVYNNGVLSKVLKWNGVNSVVCLTNTKKYIKSGKTTIEKHYYITSLPLDSDRIIETIRSHWSIENNLHWQLDVSFNEDAQKKKKNAARNFSVLHKIAMTQLKNNKRKASLKGKRKMAGWSDEFLAELLDAPWHNEEIK